MSDDPTQDSPETGDSPASTGIDWDSPDNPYIQRHRDTQAAWTRDKAVWDTEDSVMERLAERFPHLIADDEDNTEIDDDEPTGQPSIDPELLEQLKAIPELAKAVGNLTAKDSQQAFSADLKRAAGDREIPKQGRDWIEQQTDQNGNNYEALETATKAWFEFQDSLVAEAAKQRKQRPRAPHVPTGGTATDGTKSTADMTDSELLQYQMDRLNAEAA